MTAEHPDLDQTLIILKIAVAASVLFASIVAGVTYIANVNRDHSHQSFEVRLVGIEKTQREILAEQHAVLARQEIMLQVMQRKKPEEFWGELPNVRKGL